MPPLRGAAPRRAPPLPPLRGEVPRRGGGVLSQGYHVAPIRHNIPMIAPLSQPAAASILEWSRDFIELSPGQFDPERGAMTKRRRPKPPSFALWGWGLTSPLHRRWRNWRRTIPFRRRPSRGSQASWSSSRTCCRRSPSSHTRESWWPPA